MFDRTTIYGENENGEASLRVATNVTSNDPTSIYGVNEEGEACVRIMGGSGEGGGSSVVKEEDVILLKQSMPEATSSLKGRVFLYMGGTTETYTHGKMYECAGSSTYSGTVEFDVDWVNCDGDDFVDFLKEGTRFPEYVVRGEMVYDESASLWTTTLYNANGARIVKYKLYQEDLEDYGITFSETPEDGVVVNFTCEVVETSSSYAWSVL